MSLRAALTLANGLLGDHQISFDARLSGGTMSKASHLDSMTINRSVLVDGDIDDDGLADIIITHAVAQDQRPAIQGHFFRLINGTVTFDGLDIVEGGSSYEAMTGGVIYVGEEGIFTFLNRSMRD